MLSMRRRKKTRRRQVTGSTSCSSMVLYVMAPYPVGRSKTSITWDVILDQQLSLIVSVSFISPQRLYYFLITKYNFAEEKSGMLHVHLYKSLRYQILIYLAEVICRAVGLPALILFNSFLASSDRVREQSSPVSQHTAARISPLAQSKDGHLSSSGTAPYFFSTFSRSAPRPNSAFLWKTAVILIDEIQRCPKQSPRSPTVAHRQGCCSVVIVPREERSASGEHQEERKIPIFSSKEPKKRFFTGSGKVEENLFHLQTKTILAWPFFPSS